MANGTPIENPVWADIQGIFAPYTAQMMWRLNLGSYQDVSLNAQIILFRVLDGEMPPSPFPPLTAAQITTFQNWVNNGCPETAQAAVTAPAASVAAVEPPKAPGEPNPPFGQGRFRFR